MNEKTTTEKQEIIRKQLHELLDIVLDGNGIESRARDNTGTLPTLFFEYSGHINMVRIDLHSDGWQKGNTYDAQFEQYLTNPLKQEEIDAFRAKVRAALTDKKETEVLRRDIARQECKVKNEKERLSEMKKTLKRKEKKEKTAGEAAVNP